MIPDNLGDYIKSIEFSAEPWFLLDQLGNRLFSLIDYCSVLSNFVGGFNRGLRRTLKPSVPMRCFSKATP